MANQKKPYHHGDLRNSLLEAAESLLEENGIASVSLRETAKQAGVSHTAPYRHFKDKNSLLAGLAQRGFTRLADAMENCVSQHPDEPIEQLKASATAYVHLALSHPQMTALMFGGVINKNSCSEELASESDRAFNGLLRIINNGQNAGLYIDKQDRELAAFVWSLAHGFSVLVTSRQIVGEDGNEQMIECLMASFNEMVLSGIGK